MRCLIQGCYECSSTEEYPCLDAVPKTHFSKYICKHKSWIKIMGCVGGWWWWYHVCKKQLVSQYGWVVIHRPTLQHWWNRNKPNNICFLTEPKLLPGGSEMAWAEQKSILYVQYIGLGEHWQVTRTLIDMLIMNKTEEWRAAARPTEAISGLTYYKIVNLFK